MDRSRRGFGGIHEKDLLGFGRDIWMNLCWWNAPCFVATISSSTYRKRYDSGSRKQYILHVILAKSAERMALLRAL